MKYEELCMVVLLLEGAAAYGYGMSTSLKDIPPECLSLIWVILMSLREQGSTSFACGEFDVVNNNSLSEFKLTIYSVH